MESVKYVDTIMIHLPKMSKTKGGGRRKELAMKPQEKSTRLCGACEAHAYHNNRNCS